MTSKLPYPPPWQDISTLCEHTCLCEATVDKWVKLGLLPAPRMRGGKRMWKWKEVDQYLDNGRDGAAPSVDAEAEGITNATKRAIAEAGH